MSDGYSSKQLLCSEGEVKLAGCRGLSKLRSRYVVWILKPSVVQHLYSRGSMGFGLAMTITEQQIQNRGYRRSQTSKEKTKKWAALTSAALHRLWGTYGCVENDFLNSNCNLWPCWIYLPLKNMDASRLCEWRTSTGLTDFGGVIHLNQANQCWRVPVYCPKSAWEGIMHHDKSWMRQWYKEASESHGNMFSYSMSEDVWSLLHHCASCTPNIAGPHSAQLLAICLRWFVCEMRVREDNKHHHNCHIQIATRPWLYEAVDVATVWKWKWNWVSCLTQKLIGPSRFLGSRSSRSYFHCCWWLPSVKNFKSPRKCPRNSVPSKLPLPSSSPALPFKAFPLCPGVFFSEGSSLFAFASLSSSGLSDSVIGSNHVMVES